MNNQEKLSYTIHPIGYVKRINKKTYLEISKTFIPALKELQDFSHAHIIWWFYQLDNQEYRQITQIDPPYDAPKLGVFASRSPIRPNPIALSVVKIIKIDYVHGLIEIPQIEAFDNSPIIDIKAYFPSCDRVKSPKTPNWAANWGEFMPEDGLGLD